MLYPLILLGDVSCLGCNVIHLLRVSTKLESFSKLFFAAGVGFLVDSLYGVLLQWITWVLHTTMWSVRVHATIFFITNQLIYRMACLIFLALVSAPLYGVDRKCGFDSLSFPDMNGTIGFCPVVSGFRRCSSFVDLFFYLHTFKYFTCFLVCLSLKVPYL